jgi:hypothetical protein
VRQGDLATTQTLISAGADVNADDDDCASPIDLARDDSPCHFLLQHHSAAFATVNDDPNSLILSAIAHCAALSGYKDIVRAPALSLHQYQLDPSFHWAPREARFLVFKWARNAFVAQLATTIQPLNDLPDDCAGDVLGCLEMAMTYEEPLCIARHYMSPEAQFWVRAVVTAAIAVRIDVYVLENLFQLFSRSSLFWFFRTVVHLMHLYLAFRQRPGKRDSSPETRS